MEVADLHKVWEIKPLKKPGEDVARRILETVARQVQPIMRRRRWRVKLLSEFCPSNSALLGLNVGGGVHVKLRLRRPNRDGDFFPYEDVLDTMLHELCHIEHGPHNALFYKLWDDIRKECEELIEKGITGTGQGFDLPARRLGGFCHRPPLASLRNTALAAAERRKHLSSLLPSGSKRLGGDVNIMTALSPVQAAAMAAERRTLDDVWCASASYGLSDVFLTKDHPLDYISSEILDSSSVSNRDASNATFKDKYVGDVLCDSGRSMKRLKNDSSRINSSKVSEGNSMRQPTSDYLSDHFAADNVDGSAMWECMICTLFNKPLALACEACGIQRPKPVQEKSIIWSCRFCTLDNDVKLEKCSACDEWRYSHGPPLSTRGPNLGT